MDNTFNQAFKPLTNIKTIKEYEAEIESLRNENFELKSRLSQNYNPSVVNDDIKKLLLDSQTSINILENENKELRNQLQFLSNGNDSHLKIENEKLLKYIEKMNEEIEVQNERNNEEKNEMYREICDMKEKMTEFGNLKARNAELEQQHNILNEELHRRNIGTKQLQAQNSKEMQERINAYENRIQSMNTEINSLQEKVSFLSKANEEFAVLKDKATYLEQQNYELQSKVGKLDGQNANYKLTIKNLEEQKAQLTKNNNELNNMYEEIRMQRNANTNEQECTLADLRNKNNALQQEIKNLSDKYNPAKAKIRDLEKENNAFKNEQSVLGAKIGTKETYISNLQAKINKYEIYVNKVKQDYSKLQNENKLLIEQKEYLEGQISGKMSTTDNKDAIRKLESEIEKLARINHAYRKFLSDESKNKRKIYETILQFKKKLKGYASLIDNIRNKSRQIYNKENAKGQNYKVSHGELYSNINSKNKEFLQKLFPNQRSINVIISEISKMYDTMTSKIENLESELKQITYFAGNNAKNKNAKTLALIDNFVGEFKSAKDELEFCKDYLKEKGKELKELRKCKKENEAYIHNLEEKLKNSKSLGGFMDFFTVNKQAAK